MEDVQKVIAKAEKAIGRELESFEKSLVEFAVFQVKFGLVDNVR